ncbi:hypothetical protein APP_01870 [Aeribacillus pallidus]|nr:hypothetical protein APP_01870 [Aeribacillus pallidus]
MIISRELKSNSLEIWKIEIPDIESTNFLIIEDKKRPSTLKDYSWLSETDKQFFEPRENYIKVQFISNKNIEGLNIEHSEIAALTENLLGHVAQAYCSWNLDFLFNMNPDDYVREVLETYGIDRADISKFKYLSQD